MKRHSRKQSLPSTCSGFIFYLGAASQQTRLDKVSGGKKDLIIHFTKMSDHGTH